MANVQQRAPACQSGPLAISQNPIGTLSRELLALGHAVRFSAGGRSMRPTIRPGERITVAPTAPKDIRLGDIVLYDTARGLIAHRIVGCSRGAPDGFQFTPRADAAFSCDDPVDGEQALGRVVSVQRDNEWLDLTGWGAKVKQWLGVQVVRLRRSFERAAAALLGLQPGV